MSSSRPPALRSLAQAALAAMRPRGLVVVKSTYPGTLDFNPAELVVPEITVVGSRCGPFPPALRLLARKLINPKKLISRALIRWPRRKRPWPMLRSGEC